MGFPRESSHKSRPVKIPAQVPQSVTSQHLSSLDSRRALGPEQAELPAIVAEADLDGLRLSVASDFAVTSPGEKYLGAKRFRVHRVGCVDPDGATLLTLRTIAGL